MAYTPNTWVNRVANGDNRFTDQNNNVYEFTPAPISVSQSGTPFSAEWMNHIEQGIAANDAVTSKIGKLLWSGNWTPVSGKPSTIPGISDYSCLYIIAASTGCIGTKAPNGNFTSFFIAPIVFTNGSYQFYALTIYTKDDDSISSLRGAQNTVFPGEMPSVATTIDTAPLSDDFTITEIYGIF